MSSDVTLGSVMPLSTPDTNLAATPMLLGELLLEDGLIGMADLERGLGELNFPPDHPKMPGEPRRVQPSRKRHDLPDPEDRPAARRRRATTDQAD